MSFQVSSCLFSPYWSPGDNATGENRKSVFEDRVSAPGADVGVGRPLREKNGKKFGAKHVPHKEKPPQVVAKRNARERRRVQAVNSAFARLKKAVPFQNAKGKRISKVKTLQNAIKYILALQSLLNENRYSQMNFQMERYEYNSKYEFYNKYY